MFNFGEQFLKSSWQVLASEIFITALRRKLDSVREYLQTVSGP